MQHGEMDELGKGTFFDVEVMNSKTHFPKGQLKLIVAEAGIAICAQSQQLQTWSYFDLKKWGANKVPPRCPW